MILIICCPTFLLYNAQVEVRYDGWGREYNEVVPLNSSRVAPFHTFTWSVKCWAKYLNWPWWPAIVRPTFSSLLLLT